MDCEGRRILQRVQQAPEGLKAATDADAVVLVTEWSEFMQLDWSRLAEVMRGDLVIDGRNALDPDIVRAAGLAYEGIGRGPRAPSSKHGGRPAAPVSGEPT